MDAPVTNNPHDDELSDDILVELIELIYFGYRDFISDPDAVLEDMDFGRAHHRVIHFVGRKPGLSVAELLLLLRITKQSLARVLRELLERNIIEQRSDTGDRRKRLLFLTDEGRELHTQLMAPQLERIKSALQDAGRGSADVFQQLLLGMVNEEDREQVKRVVRS